MTPVSLFLVLLLAYVLIKIKLILILILLAVLVATLLEHPVHKLEQRHVPRAAGILLSYIVILGGIALLAFIFTPVISREVGDFKADAPAQIRQLEVSWQNSGNGLLNGPGQQLLERIATLMENPPIPKETAVRFATGAVSVIVGLVAVLVIAFYYLMEKRLIRRLILMEVSPKSRPRVRRVWDEVEAKVGGWLRGQLLLCLIIGLTATIGYGAMGVRFWALLGLLAGITEFMPIIGPWLGGIPAVVMALTQSWEKAFMVAIFILGLQFLENAILVPRVMKGAVGLTPLTIFTAILAGTEFIGVAGALLAIPIAAAVQVIVADYLNARRETHRELARPVPSWRWMRGYLRTELSRSSEERSSEPSQTTEQQAEATAPETESTTRPGWTTDLVARAASAARRLTPDDHSDNEPEPPERRAS